MTPHERKWKKELNRRKVRAARKRAQSEHYGHIRIHPGNPPPSQPPPTLLAGFPREVPKGKYTMLDSLKKMFRRKV